MRDVRENTTMDPRELREATRAEHEATEAIMPLGGADLSRELYCRVLRAMQPLVAGWEVWAEAEGPQDLREMLMRRRRSHLLAADLRAMGEPVASNFASPVDWDAAVMQRGGREGGLSGQQEFEAAFLGAMYVMEGSTLGGRFVARHVESVLELEPGQGSAYFQGHGELTGSLWREVTGRIAQVPDELSPVVIGAARRTFEAFGQALRQGLAASQLVQP